MKTKNMCCTKSDTKMFNVCKKLNMALFMAKMSNMFFC